MDRIVEKWIERAEYDLETARAMLHARRYLYVAYCIEARYGDYKESLNEIIDKEKAETLFKETERTFQWILQKID